MLIYLNLKLYAHKSCAYIRAMPLFPPRMFHFFCVFLVFPGCLIQMEYLKGNSVRKCVFCPPFLVCKFR